MENASEYQAEPVIDCGVASQETKGLPYGLLFEFVSPPFDRAYIG